MTSFRSSPAYRRRAHALVLSTGVAIAALTLPAVAFAQEAAPVAVDTAAQTASESLTDDIVVNGRRQRSALNEEQAAIGTIDIVTTGDVAIHSQTNIADLAKQLPGISVSRDQGRNQSATGEAQFVTIRGFDTGYNAYTLDGLRLPQTAGNSRAISLNLFSPFAIGGIAADKTPGAAKDADSIAGIIDLRTPTAFDFAQSFTRARVLGQVAGLALDREQEAFGGAVGIDAARRFGNDDQFGVYVAGYFEERGNTAESTAVQNDYKPTRANAGNSRANPNDLTADGVQWNFYNNKIKRYGATGSVDFRGDAIELYGRVNYATYLNTNTMNQTGLRNELTRGQTNPNGGAYNAGGIYTPLGINPASYFRTEDVEQELLSTQVGAKAHWDGFFANLEGAYADGRFDQPKRIEAAFRGIAYNGAAGNTGAATEGVNVDLSNPKSPRPVLSAGAIAYVSSLDRPTQLYVQQGYDFLREVKKTAKASIGWDGDGFLGHVEVGGLYEDSDRDGRSLAPDNTRFRFLTPLQSGTVQGPSINQYLGYVLKDFLDYYPNRPLKVLSRVQLDAQARDFVPLVTVSQTTLNQGLLDGNEKRKAAYGTATLKLGTLEVMPGIRYEDNGFRATYFLSDADGARFVAAGRDYDHLDPSVLAAWKPNDRIVVRGAARSSYARPSFDLIAGPTRITRDPSRNNAIIAISQPNPDLKPVQAWSYDVGIDYYAGVGRYLQLAAYYKDLSNFVVSTATRTAGETIDGIVYTRPINGGGGKAKGIEASGRFTVGDMVGSAFLGNFGVGGNITYQQTEATYVIPVNGVRTTRTSALPQAPDLIYNAELFYAGGGFRTNLWYNYTGKILAGVQDSQPDIYVQPVGELNFGAAYEVTDNLEIGVSARNLLDQHAYWATVGKSERYIANDRNGGYLKTGRVFQFSLTMKM